MAFYYSLARIIISHRQARYIAQRFAVDFAQPGQLGAALFSDDFATTTCRTLSSSAPRPILPGAGAPLQGCGRRRQAPARSARQYGRRYVIAGADAAGLTARDNALDATPFISAQPRAARASID